ncbi:hypothetical protein KR018_000473, partial [Drosophila ironensis]
SIMGKVRRRVSSILPASLSGWFSPSAKAGGGNQTQQNPNPSQTQVNGDRGTTRKRKRGRRRIELAAEDAPAGFVDVDDQAKGLNMEEVALADNIAEHDLAAEDEQTRRSEYSDNVFLQRRRRGEASGRPYDDHDPEEDDDDVDGEEEEEDDDDDDEDELQQNPSHSVPKRRRLDFDTTQKSGPTPRLPLGSSTPAAFAGNSSASIGMGSASEQHSLPSRFGNQQRHLPAHRRTHLNPYGIQRQREPAYNFLVNSHQDLRRYLNLPCSPSVGGSINHTNSLSSSGVTLSSHMRRSLLQGHQEQPVVVRTTGHAMADDSSRDLEINQATGANDAAATTTATNNNNNISNNNNTNNVNINNNVVKSLRRGTEVGDSGSEQNDFDDDAFCSNQFYGNLQSSKSLFNRMNATTYHEQQPAHHNSSWSLESMNRRRRFNNSIYSSNSALSDSRLLSRSASASGAAGSTASPFYQGLTAFGGHSANNRSFSQTNLSSSAASTSTLALNSRGSSPAHVPLYVGGVGYGMKPVEMRPDPDPNESQGGRSDIIATSKLSNTTKRILSLLESYSTPLIDARRMGTNLREHQNSRQRRNPYTNDANNDSTRSESASGRNAEQADAEQEDMRSNRLLVPTMQQLLERRRLHRVTQASRELCDTIDSRTNGRSTHKTMLPVMCPGDEAPSQHTNKIRTKLSHQTRHRQSTDERQQPPSPPDLPQIRFPDMASQPMFDLVFRPKPPAVPAATNMKLKPVANGNGRAISGRTASAGPRLQYGFPGAEVLPQGVQPVYGVKRNRNYRFPSADGLETLDTLETSSSSSSDERETKRPALAPAINGFGDQFKKSASEWECDMCMVRNKSEASKCVACETPKPGAKPKQSTPFLTGPEPKRPLPADGGLLQMFKMSAGDWECDTCLVRNKSSASKCVACDMPNKKRAAAAAVAPAPAPVTNFPSGFGAAFKPQSNTWECQTCLVRNQSSAIECVACQTRNPNANNIPKSISISDGSNSSSSTSSTSSLASSVISISSGSGSGNGSSTNGATAPPATGTKVVTLFGVTSKPDDGFQKLVDKQKNEMWGCEVCLAQNNMNNKKCICCDEMRPGSMPTASGIAGSGAPKFKFGFSQVKEVPPEVPSILAAATATPAANFTFGFGQTNATALKPSDFSNPTGFPQGFLYDASAQPKAVTFGNFAATTNTTSAEAFAPKAAATPVTVPAAAPAANNFVFGAPATSAGSALAASTPAASTFAFGAPAPSGTSSSGSTFTTSSSPFSTSSASFNTSNAFATTSSAFSTSNAFSTSSAFTTTSATTSAAAPAAVPATNNMFVFGNPAAVSAVSSSMGTNSTTTTSSSTSGMSKGFAFDPPAPSSNPAQQNIFGSASQPVGNNFFMGQTPAAAASTASTTAPTISSGTTSMSGSNTINTTPMFQMPASTGAVGTASTPSENAFGAGSTNPSVFSFGADKRTETTSTKPFTFGSNAGLGAPSSTTTAPTATAPTFGTWGSNGATTNTSTASGPQVFGANIFGSPATSNSMPFGSAAMGGNGPVFGNASNPVVPAPATANIFGSANANVNANATPMAAAAPPVFGSGPVNVGFGSAASTAAGNTALSGAKPAFSFGNSTAAPQISGAPFNFGASNELPKPAFNFTGSVTASTPQVGAFNFSAAVPSPNMGGDSRAGIFQFGSTGPVQNSMTGGFGGAMAAMAGVESGGFASSNAFNFNAPMVPQMQSTPNANAPFQFGAVAGAGAGAATPAANIFAFNPSAGGSAAQNSQMARRKTKIMNRRVPPR